MSHSTDSTPSAENDETGPDLASRHGHPRRRRVLLTAGAVVVVAALVVAGVVVARSSGGNAAEAVPATVPVSISAPHVPGDTKLGVVLTLGTGEGSEWSGAAQGALVAQRRLALGGTDVALITQNDGGTSAGAKKAVDALVARGVAGIVVASSGAHVQAAVDAAATAGVPVVLPYEQSPSDDAWSLAPVSSDIGAGLARALDGAKAPLLVDLGGTAPTGISFTRIVKDDGTQDDDGLAAEVAGLTGVTSGSSETAAPAATRADAILVSGPAAREASFLASLQSTDVSVPVVLTPDATSPAFGTALVAAGGSTSGSFTTAGVEADDAVALQPDASGRAMSAFLTGVRVLSGSSSAKNLTGDQAFSAVAASADSRSHDAVVALARAVSSARSADPAAVATALGGLRLGVADGIAGPALDLAKHQALTGPTTVLYASGQPLGLRGDATTDDQPLIWFAEGAEKSSK
ncbi:hypothetical protein GCM10025867_17770 [Frondihabitans sucicola]|uniref:Leucine-binding protein domain-containing protein n=1 Tax=Frondihabitans sucicola TaxID=1268041 RepID=A0ABM8GM90_9MICO|nr:hypothetical protein [Frondihabitans sucicola]BDZ49536.1 hypothetical protein GCM10025867_17770 [Frondihabitans sucicola]